MIKLEDYIYSTEIDKACDFLMEDPINEGKIMNGIKKVWNWITGKNRKKKKKDSVDNYYSSSLGYSSRYNSFIDNVDYDEISYSDIKEYTYDDLRYKVKDLNNIKKIKSKFEQEGYSNKLKFIGIEKKDIIIAIAIYCKKEDSPLKFNNFLKKFDYIFAIQVAKNDWGKDITKKFIKYLKDNLSKNSTFNGLAINKNEYESKPIYKNLEFEPYKEKENIICYYKQY